MHVQGQLERAGLVIYRLLCGNRRSSYVFVIHMGRQFIRALPRPLSALMFSNEQTRHHPENHRPANGELEVYFRAAQFSRAEATHESSKAENKYDTRGLEASYLARGQSKQAAELEAAIAEFEKLPVKKFGADEPIGLGALVELENGGENSFYFIGPRAGGTEMLHDKKEILVITPQSPLGEQLMGKKSGDRPQLNFSGAKQPARIVRVE